MNHTVASETASQAMTDEWRRWIAENLILGNDPQQLYHTLVGAGFGEAVARAEVQQAQASPYLAGAQRLKNRLAKHDWVLDCQRQLNQLRNPEIPRRHRLGADEFFELYYSANRPVIITGMLEDWPAMQKWNLDYFRAGWGDCEVEVQFGRNADEHYELNKTAHRRMMRFGDFVDLVATSGRTNDFYMTANNNSHNQRVLSTLWRDIVQIPEYLDGSLGDQGFFWLGPQGTITPFHHDLTNNFMAQVMGRKRVLIMPACEIGNVYNHAHCFTHVDGRAVDLQRFPAMRNAQILECVLNPGEILFLPVGCWHFVEGLDISCTVSFINFRWNNDYASFYPALRDF
ncbi:cupin-like domain-containing protein [Chitiniphilus purpureus]|uniref:Cupin-like domain-containing protein n=1 Tax=Chitiniphilus purpureus TaxID=2981137 RepID=A0ABY6DMI9_9NEIS|nr:cupin-like domain-containing protein [Chitiniphilus sp. CD1]UXY14903.1 cupin-like domain-containing protein [Chitiniphilus sp. CD1]